MDTERKCGCKGRRTCLWCEKEHDLKPDFTKDSLLKQPSYVYCPKCNLAWEGWNMSLIEDHPNHTGKSIEYPGIFILEDFLSPQEVDTLLTGIDNEPWDISQSGRRKQNYGPKCNFRKRKLAKGNFNGFPKFSLFVQNKLRAVPCLDSYFVIEQCSLEYDPIKGASIDPHIDDCWIWGERIVTVNVIADSVLTMIPYRGPKTKYNLDLIDGLSDRSVEDIVVRIPMPERSLLVISGEARYLWEHAVLREDVSERRVCLAYREFTEPYLPGGKFEEHGKSILEISKQSLLVGC